MARTVITKIKLNEPNTASAQLTTDSLTAALDASAGGEVVWNGSDEKTLVLVQNTGSAAADFIVKAGNGIQGVNDLKVNVTNGKTIYMQLDSGRFKNVSGADKGKVVFGGGASFKVAVFELA